MRLHGSAAVLQLPVLSRSGAAVRLRGPAAVLTRCRTAVLPCGRAAMRLHGSAAVLQCCPYCRAPVLPCGCAARRPC
jgi:hypothetical protein